MGDGCPGWMGEEHVGRGNSQLWVGLSQAKLLRLELGGDDETAVETELIDVSEKNKIALYRLGN